MASMTACEDLESQRMQVPCRWGHVLAAHTAGKGRGFRSLYHTAQHGCLVHDASYWQPWELTGSLDQLRGCLEVVRCWRHRL